MPASSRPRPGGNALPHSAEVTGGPQERSPGASAPGPLFPSGRFLPRFFAQLAQVLHHFFGRDAWAWIVDRCLYAALEQLAAQIGMGFQFLMLAQDHEHGFGRIEVFAAFDPGVDQAVVSPAAISITAMAAGRSRSNCSGLDEAD